MSETRVLPRKSIVGVTNLPPSEMEKAADAADAVSAIFCTGVLIFVFSSIFLMVLHFCVQFFSFLHDFLHDFKHFLHIFCVLIFHSQSFFSAIFFNFSISD